VSVTSDCRFFVLTGSVESSSLEATVWRRTFDVSTRGAAPVTVIVSSSDPTWRSTLTVAVNPDVSAMPSRRTTLNPGSVKVTV
jgi:hypothetical protein